MSADFSLTPDKMAAAKQQFTAAFLETLQDQVPGWVGLFTRLATAETGLRRETLNDMDAALQPLNARLPEVQAELQVVKNRLADGVVANAGQYADGAHPDLIAARALQQQLDGIGLAKENLSSQTAILDGDIRIGRNLLDTLQKLAAKGDLSLSAPFIEILRQIVKTSTPTHESPTHSFLEQSAEAIVVQTPRRDPESSPTHVVIHKGRIQKSATPTSKKFRITAILGEHGIDLNQFDIHYKSLERAFSQALEKYLNKKPTSQEKERYLLLLLDAPEESFNDLASLVELAGLRGRSILEKVLGATAATKNPAEPEEQETKKPEPTFHPVETSQKIPDGIRLVILALETKNKAGLLAHPDTEHLRKAFLGAKAAKAPKGPQGSTRPKVISQRQATEIQLNNGFDFLTMIARKAKVNTVEELLKLDHPYLTPKLRGELKPFADIPVRELSRIVGLLRLPRGVKPLTVPDLVKKLESNGQVS